jgi:hypothetical protein
MKIKGLKGKDVALATGNKNLVTTLIVSIIVVVLAIALFFTLSQVLAKEDYYVLKQDVSAKTQISEDMLKKIETAKGSAPQNAISIQQVRQGTVYTRIPLKAGDVLSKSNTGLDLDSTNGIPDDWVVVSFNISSDNAAGGNISKGDYFDIIGIDPDGGAKYLFFNVLALEVNYTKGESKVTSDGKVVPLGEQLQYVVGVPADKAPTLLHAFEKFKTVKLAMSPMSLKYKNRDTSSLDQGYTADFSTSATDLFAGTDSAFTPILRDKNGLPVTQESCKDGKVDPKSLCSNINKLPKKKDLKTNVTEKKKNIEKSENKKAEKIDSDITAN